MYEHAGIHAGLTTIVLLLSGLAPWLALADGLIPFTVDWTKVQLTTQKKLTPADTAFWWAVGLDQYAHGLTYLTIAALVYQS